MVFDVVLRTGRNFLDGCGSLRYDELMARQGH